MQLYARHNRFQRQSRFDFSARRIAMHKIEIRAIQPVENSVVRAHLKRVPAHMRHFEWWCHIQRIDRSCKPTQPLVLAALCAGGTHDCMPTQMPRNGRPSSTTRASSAACSPLIAARPLRAIAKGADTGQNDMVGACHNIRIARNIEPAIRRTARKGFFCRPQISRPIVNNSNIHVPVAPPAPPISCPTHPWWTARHRICAGRFQWPRARRAPAP